jgi:hypothetical protein
MQYKKIKSPWSSVTIEIDLCSLCSSEITKISVKREKVKKHKQSTIRDKEKNEQSFERNPWKSRKSKK